VAFSRIRINCQQSLCPSIEQAQIFVCDALSCCMSLVPIGVPWWDPTNSISATVLLPPADYACQGFPHMGDSAGPGGGGGTICRCIVLDHYIVLDTLDISSCVGNMQPLLKATLPSSFLFFSSAMAAAPPNHCPRVVRLACCQAARETRESGCRMKGGLPAVLMLDSVLVQHKIEPTKWCWH
jgi:hypothetical protein